MRCWTTAIGRWPIGAQTFRRSGLSPMRWSSVVHSSTLASGKASATAVTSGRRFFELRLLFWTGQGIARSRCLAALLEALQIVPAPLHLDGTAELVRHPVGDRATGPVFGPAGRRAGKGL